MCSIRRSREKVKCFARKWLCHASASHASASHANGFAVQKAKCLRHLIKTTSLLALYIIPNKIGRKF